VIAMPTARARLFMADCTCHCALYMVEPKRTRTFYMSLN